MQYDISQDADASAANDPRNYQDWKVHENLQVGNQECGNQDLPQIVSNAAGHGNSGDRKQPCLFQQDHHEHAEQCASQRVECAEKTGEQKTSDKYTDQVYQQCVMYAQIVERDDHCEVGDAEFDARDPEIERDQDLYIRKYESQSRQQGSSGNLFRVACVFHGHPLSHRSPVLIFLTLRLSHLATVS